MELPSWAQPGMLPIPVRWEPPPDSLRAAHGKALRDSLQDRVDVETDRDDERRTA